MINFLISVCCSVSFHTMQFYAENYCFSTPFPAFGHFYRSHFLPPWNGSVIGSAARLPQIMQCFQAKHRCVFVRVCASLCLCECVSLWRDCFCPESQSDPQKVQQQAQTSPHNTLPRKPSRGIGCAYRTPTFAQCPRLKFPYAFLKLGLWCPF